MHRTDIVDRPHEIHLGLNRGQLAGQMARPPGQGRTPFAKRRIQLLDARRARDHAVRRPAQHPGNP